VVICKALQFSTKCSIVYQSDYKISHLIITIAFSLAKKKKHRDLKADICF